MIDILESHHLASLKILLKIWDNHDITRLDSLTLASFNPENSKWQPKKLPLDETASLNLISLHEIGSLACYH